MDRASSGIANGPGQWPTNYRHPQQYGSIDAAGGYQSGGRDPYPQNQWRAVPRHPQEQPRLQHTYTQPQRRSNINAVFQGLNPPDPLERTYKVHEPRWFQRYRVFKIWWHENAGAHSSGGSSVRSGFTQESLHGEWIYSKFRWLIVIGQTETHSLCLPIMTYRGQGVEKDFVDARVHAIAFTGDVPPPLSAAERAQGTMRTPIKVQNDDPTTMLDPKSRIDYSRIYTVEHNVKVKAFGYIYPQSRAAFDADRMRILQSLVSPSGSSLTGAPATQMPTSVTHTTIGLGTMPSRAQVQTAMMRPNLTNVPMRYAPYPAPGDEDSGSEESSTEGSEDEAAGSGDERD